jgi:hypothetical protein
MSQVARVTSGPRTYSAARVDPHEHRDELVRLWGDNLTVLGDPHAKLDWLYLRSPVGPGEAFVLRDEAEAPVGCAGITTRELWFGDRVLRAALLGDLAIDRAHRTGMPALVLQRATKRHVEATYDMAYGFPNAGAVAIHRRIGFHELGVMSRYVRVLRHGGYLARKYGRPGVMRAAGAILDGAKLGVRLARAMPRAVRAELRWLDDFDPRFDDLWQRTRSAWGVVGRRDAALLRWRFLRKPAERVRIAALVERNGKRLLAYAVIGGEAGDLAHLHDVFGPLDAVSDLLMMLVPALTVRGYSAMSMRFLGDPRMMDLVVGHGMELRDARRSVITTFAPQCADAGLRQWASWYITDLDEDS